MNTKHALALALALACSTALAGTNKDTGEVCQGSDCSGGGDSGAVPSVVSTNSNVNQAIGVGVGVGVSSSDSAAVSSASGAATVNAYVSSGGGDYKDYTPSVSAPRIDPTVPCAIPVSVGVGVPGFAASGGTAYVDTGCEQRELIRIGLTSGNVQAEAKAAALLNRQLDAALAANEESAAVASGRRDSSQREYIFSLTQ